MAGLRLLFVGSVVAVFVACPELQPRVREGREMAVQAVRAAQRILTAAQRAKLPVAIRQPFRPCTGRLEPMFIGPR